MSEPSWGWTFGPLPSNVRVGANTIITGDQWTNAQVFRKFKSRLDPALILGEHCLMDGVSFNLGERARVTIGDHCRFEEAFLIAEQELQIGNRVTINWRATIVDSDFHPLAPSERMVDVVACSPLAAGVARPTLPCRPVVIEDDVWIGANVTILKGVRIGAGAFVEPGSVVVRDVPAGARVLGNPAEVIAETLKMSSTRTKIVDGRRVLEGDWYPGTIPHWAQIDPTAYVGSSQSFIRDRSQRPFGAVIGRGASLCDATSLDVGPRGIVRLGELALVTAARIICDAEIEIGAYALVSWDVVLMDSYRAPLSPALRKRMALGEQVECEPPRPIRLGRNSWVGFGACVLPGVTVGEGSIVAARSVVTQDVPPYVVVAGNPARIVRSLR